MRHGLAVAVRGDPSDVRDIGPPVSARETRGQEHDGTVAGAAWTRDAVDTGCRDCGPGLWLWVPATATSVTAHVGGAPAPAASFQVGGSSCLR